MHQEVCVFFFNSTLYICSPILYFFHFILCKILTTIAVVFITAQGRIRIQDHPLKQRRDSICGAENTNQPTITYFLLLLQLLLMSLVGQVLERIVKGVEVFGFRTEGWIESPIKGAEGNTEFLACFHRVPAAE